MDEFENAAQLLAQTTRTLRLLNFKFMQLRHTNDQLLASLHDLLDQVSRGSDHGDADDASPPDLPG